MVNIYFLFNLIGGCEQEINQYSDRELQFTNSMEVKYDDNFSYSCINCRMVRDTIPQKVEISMALATTTTGTGAYMSRMW